MCFTENSQLCKTGKAGGACPSMWTAADRAPRATVTGAVMTGPSSAVLRKPQAWDQGTHVLPHLSLLLPKRAKARRVIKLVLAQLPVPRPSLGKQTPPPKPHLHKKRGKAKRWGLQL